MRIDSATLIYADQQIDRYGIGLSFISNLVNIILKIGIVCRRCFASEKLDMALNAHPNKHYWEYLEKKPWLECFVFAIPVIGNAVKSLLMPALLDNHAQDIMTKSPEIQKKEETTPSNPNLNLWRSSRYA